MQPVFNKGMTASAAFRLRDLVLMMREDQITAAAMKIEGFP